MTPKHDANALRDEWRKAASKLAEVEPLSVEAGVLLAGMAALRVEHERLTDEAKDGQSEPPPESS